MKNTLFALAFGLLVFSKITAQDTLLTTADCLGSVVIALKEDYLIPFAAGAGQDETELYDATCFANGVPQVFELNSSWMRWKCPSSGQIVFQITPLNPTDDLDFVVYSLDSTGENCTGKQLVRCMAAGDFNFPSPCMGPTGLKFGETDVAESVGCGPDKNNFLAPLNVQAGDWFALGVNNFTSTGEGYLIHFGGNGTFVSSQEPTDWPTVTRLFPNPTDGLFQVDFFMEKAGERQFFIKNTAGISVFERTENLPDGPQKLVFDFENQPPGLFFLTMTDRQTTSVLRFLKR